jgi:catechol 2,3-dioxygenase-like lactoylglutathione lyase family enzyme
MDQRISLVTLAVSDLDATRRFYLDGLGWESFIDVPGDVLMVQVGEHLLLSFWVEAGFEAEVGPIRRGSGLVPITLAHNVGTDAEVDAVLTTAREAGADLVEPAVKREWGGYSGYFADPDGYRWEIAHAPGEIKDLVVPR